MVLNIYNSIDETYKLHDKRTSKFAFRKSFNYSRKEAGNFIYRTLVIEANIWTLKEQQKSFEKIGLWNHLTPAYDIYSYLHGATKKLLKQIPHKLRGSKTGKNVRNETFAK